MTFFVDWNAGGVIAGEGLPIDEGDTPWWEIRVYSGVNSDTDEWPIHGGWSLGNGEIDAAGMDVSLDWNDYPDIIEWLVVPLNGNYNNGYIVEIKIKAPDNAKLAQGKVIPIELHVTDNMKGEDFRDGRKYLAYHDNFGSAWMSPGNAGGRFTLGAEYAPPAPEPEPAPDSGEGGGDSADISGPAVAAPAPAAPPTSDMGVTVFITLLAASAAGIVALRKKSI